MAYRQSQEIEMRLRKMLRLMRTGRYSTRLLAEELGVSIPTISRCIGALRSRGYEIQPVKTGRHWCYVIPRSNRVSDITQIEN